MDNKINVYKTSKTIVHVLNGVDTMYNHNICVTAPIYYDCTSFILKTCMDIEYPYHTTHSYSDNQLIIYQNNLESAYYSHMELFQYVYLSFNNKEERDVAYDCFLYTTMAEII